jgi:Outer membrane protein beta-barrel domain
MKNFILLSLIMLPLFTFSQSRSSIDFMISPDLTYRYTNTFGNNSFVKNISDSIEKPSIGYHFGVNYNRKISKNMYLSGGIQFSKMGYSASMDNLIFASDIDPFSGLPTSAHSLKIYYDIQLIAIPIELRYNFNDNKFSPYLKIGLAPTYNLFSRSKSTLDMEGEQIRINNYLLNHFTAFLQIGIGGNLQLNDKWQIFAEQTFRYQLTPLRNTGDKIHLYSIGLELGTRMRI